MAKNRQTEFNLLIPSLALSMLVFLLVIFVINLPNPSSQPVASAAQDKVLSSGNDIESLESDLILLQADDLSEELSVLDSVD